MLQSPKGRLLEGFSIGRVTWKEYGRITRFVSVAFLILLMHVIVQDGFVETMWGIVKPTLIDYDEFAFALATVLLYTLSYLFIKRAGKSHVMSQ